MTTILEKKTHFQHCEYKMCFWIRWYIRVVICLFININWSSFQSSIDKSFTEPMLSLHTHRQTHTDTQTQTYRYRQRHKHTQTDAHTDRQTDIETHTQTYRHTQKDTLKPAACVWGVWAAPCRCSCHRTRSPAGGPREPAADLKEKKEKKEKKGAQLNSSSTNNYYLIIILCFDILLT